MTSPGTFLARERGTGIRPAVNGDRLLADLQSLARVGATASGGVSRTGFSLADRAGRDWFRTRAGEAGLEVRIDGAGNLSALLPASGSSHGSGDSGRRTVLTGSHLDTVTEGGRYDGSLGVLAGLEVLRTIREAGLRLAADLEVISFTDEEGTIFSQFGSRALTGHLPADRSQAPGRAGEGLEEALGSLGITWQGALEARRRSEDLLSFVELHIEQGTRLEEAGLDLGVVTGIVGIRSAWLTLLGRAGHAGTLAMDQRRDALWGASELVLRARDLVRDRFFPGVVNFGCIEVSPGAFNVVPGEVKLALEFRHGDEETLDQMESALTALAAETAERAGLGLRVVGGDSCPAAPSSAGVLAAIERAADSLGLSHTRLTSFAGHDAQMLTTITPSAMIFVPSIAGVSHSPAERTRDRDVVQGANALLHTMLELAREA